MSLINKYDDVNRNILVLGASVLQFLKKRDCSIEDLFQMCKRELGIELNQLLNIVTLLWLLELLIINGNILSINNAQ